VIDRLVAVFDGLTAWQATVVLLGASLVAAVVVEFVVLRLASRAVRRTDTKLDNIVVEELRLPLVVTAALAGVYLLSRTPSVVETTLLPSGVVADFFGKPSLVVIIVVWAWAANEVVNRLVDAVKDKGSRFDFAPVFSNVWTLVVSVAALGALLTLYNVNITPLLGAAGVAGIAVGFAAKDTVANFFGGIALYFDDTYKIGDYVVLDSGEAGTVVKVGIRSTTLLTRDEVLVTVPNSVLNAAKIINESAPGRRKRVRVPIGVAYGTDIDAFEELVVALAEAEKLVLDSPKPRMRFRSFGDSALQYELLCWVASPTRASRAQHELNRAIYKELTRADIEIPYPKRDVTVTTMGEAVTSQDDGGARGDTAGGDADDDDGLGGVDPTTDGRDRPEA
jgi:small-conductance mechanosensitive channel